MVATGGGSRVPLPEYLEGLGEQVLGKETVQGSGYRLPILVKFIDAREDLSVQVHPSDEQARELGEADSGKDEAWLIVDAEDGAVIHLGFRAGVSPAGFEADLTSSETNVAHKYLQAVPVKRGDVFFVPAGTIHSIGRGVVLVEIEQASSITYRVWDWNRQPRRPLHIPRAMRVLDFAAKPETAFRRTPERISEVEEVLVESRHFAMHRLTLAPGAETTVDTHGGLHLLTCLEGEAVLKQDAALEREAASEKLRRGQSLIVPASMESYRVKTGRGTTLLKSLGGG